MPIRNNYIMAVVFLFLFYNCKAQNILHFSGPLGFYHITFGKTYIDTTGKDSISVQQLFNEGEPCFPSQAYDLNLSFKAELDSCKQWQTNRIMGMIQPISEYGKLNQTGDTDLWHPFPLIDSPGMIQAAQRFSRLSQRNYSFYGAVIDDWHHDTFTTRCLQAAIKGKPINAEGSVCFTCTSATPCNKLFAVMYNTSVDSLNLPYIDGISYWPNTINFWDINASIDALQKNWPHKEIFVGIYIYNSIDHFINPFIVHFLLSKVIDRYDAGDINGMTLFAGPYLAQDRITKSQWNKLALPHWLDSLYYPFLGTVHGLVYDCKTGAAVQGAKVRISCLARAVGDTLVRSIQQTGADGTFNAGLWAGNRNTDSTLYTMIITKDNYQSDTQKIFIKRLQVVRIPDIRLCPLNNTGLTNKSSLYMSPNPAHDHFTLFSVNNETGDILQIYNMTGDMVYQGILYGNRTEISTSSFSSGIYGIHVLHLKSQRPDNTMLEVLH